MSSSGGTSVATDPSRCSSSGTSRLLGPRRVRQRRDEQVLPRRLARTHGAHPCRLWQLHRQCWVDRHAAPQCDQVGDGSGSNGPDRGGANSYGGASRRLDSGHHPPLQSSPHHGRCRRGATLPGSALPTELRWHAHLCDRYRLPPGAAARLPAIVGPCRVCQRKPGVNSRRLSTSVGKSPADYQPRRGTGRLEHREHHRGAGIAL